MKIKPENVLTCSQATSQIKCRAGAIKEISRRMACSSKTVSRALHGERNQVSENLYLAIRSTGLREYEGAPFETRRIRL